MVSVLLQRREYTGMKRKKYGAEPGSREERDVVTVGIASAGSGCGVTHFTLLMANYLAAVERKRTAVLEWKEQESLGQLRRICTGEEGAGPFSVFDVDYFPRSGAREMAECLKTHSVLLLDFGQLGESDMPLFLQCGICCFLASLSEWKIGDLLRCRPWILQGRRSWNYLMTFGSEEARREAERRYRLPFQRIPYAPDAFSISRETAQFLSGIWKKSR